MIARSSLATGAALAAFLALAPVGPAAAQSAPAAAPLAETIAREALVIDAQSGAILLAKNQHTAFAPASLAKLMTAEIVFAALAEGELTPETTFPVSEHAWRTGGAPSRTSTMFAAVRSQVPVSALLQGLVVHAANDAAIIIAEGIAGSEAAFAILMNERAAELGLAGSRFVNPTGLPADGQSVTAADLARLALHIAQAYPDRYPLFAQPAFEWNGINQTNRNPLLRLDLGATGLALGYAEADGYKIVGAAEREGRSTIVALGGIETDDERTREAARLLRWAQDGFDRRMVLAAGESVGRASVFGGVLSDVPLVLDQDLVAFVPRDAEASVRARLVYDGPLRAPVAKGERVGQVEIVIGDEVSIAQAIFAGEDIARGSFPDRALGAAHELAFGWIRAL